MDYTSLLWEETGRDVEAERAELARTAALADADQILGALVFPAIDTLDFSHRLALAESSLQAIAQRRGYAVADLEADIVHRWELLNEARTAADTAQLRSAAAMQVTAAQEERMDSAVARLAALAARENPMVPMSECLRVASEAVRKHADAYPLAYESWGGTHDGPITDRAKKWRPPGMGGGSNPAAATAPGDGGEGTFDEVHDRLDALDQQLANSGPSGPSGPTSPTASLDPLMAGVMQRLKDWWRPQQQEQPHVTPVAAPSHTEEPAHHEEHVAPYDPTGWWAGSASREAEDRADLGQQNSHDTQGRNEYHDLMHSLDHAQSEMSHKWDTPAADRFESPAERAEHARRVNDARFNHMDQRLDQAGAPQHHPAPIQTRLF
ncbi:hypothetical protein [Streptomyces sp. NPDC059761]|uniref:hypothetical protein n=1 Tax=Streptomyces sp. NPDC059761 TaxID=3346937 RepID=UPI00364C7EAD